MTCNLNWPEIKELLRRGEESHNRPDLVARVFKAKLSILNDRIMKGDIFGEPQFKYMTPDTYDRIVSSELPDKKEDPYLYSLVVKHMMRGSCGEMNSENVCMIVGRCKNYYPKDYAEYTSYGK
ncbi:hypothetical protein LIER_40061 [Lithospermum erythrorhizon]|uniref:Helitron helicase-like domain-containing protein n=1 Tax=Lithospermum erythrorhizon TaxID=34254 RepID=A0AAV3QQI7_LITER